MHVFCFIESISFVKHGFNESTSSERHRALWVSPMDRWSLRLNGICLSSLRLKDHLETKEHFQNLTSKVSWLSKKSVRKMVESNLLVGFVFCGKTAWDGQRPPEREC